MGNCLSAESSTSDEHPHKPQSHGSSGNLKGLQGPDQSRVSPIRRRGARVSPGSQPHKEQADGATSAPLPFGSPTSACHAIGGRSSTSSSSCGSLFSDGALLDSYSLGERLGAGRYGVVRACTRKADGAKLACKFISSAQGAKDAAMEVEVLELLRGQVGVVQVETVFQQRPGSRPRGAWTSPWAQHKGAQPIGGAGPAAGAQGQEVEEVQIVMDRCFGGTLAERLQEKGHFSEQDSLCILRSILQTMQLLHSHGFIYRDVKDTNFLFKHKNDNSSIVAIDFGLATPFKHGEVLDEVAGSPLYIAPEVVRRAYGPQCDVWSAGVLFHQLLCGRHPFQRDSVTAVLKAVTTDGVLDLESEPWTAVSEASKQLLRDMLTRDPDTRPTPAQLLEQLSQDETFTRMLNGTDKEHSG